MREVEKTTDHVDILFANAGATWGAAFDKHPDGAFAKVMDLNVKSVFNTIRLYVPLSIIYDELIFLPVLPLLCKVVALAYGLIKIRTSPPETRHDRRPLPRDSHCICCWPRSWHARRKRYIWLLGLERFFSFP